VAEGFYVEGVFSEPGPVGGGGLFHFGCKKNNTVAENKKCMFPFPVAVTSFSFQVANSFTGNNETGLSCLTVNGSDTEMCIQWGSNKDPLPDQECTMSGQLNVGGETCVDYGYAYVPAGQTVAVFTSNPIDQSPSSSFQRIESAILRVEFVIP
jgi:hypothetical protein